MTKSTFDFRLFLLLMVLCSCQTPSQQVQNSPPEFQRPTRSTSARLEAEDELAVPAEANLQLVSDEHLGGSASADFVPPDAANVGEMTTAAGVALAWIEQLALENNPTIRQASASAYKGMGTRDQVGFRPNPTLEYSGVQLGDAGTDQHMLSISQDVVTAGKLGLNRQVLHQAVQSQLWEVEAQRRRVVTDIRISFYQALAAQQRHQLAEEFCLVAAKGVETAENRKAASLGSQPEVLQAEIQLQQVEVLQQQAQFELRGAWQRLAATAGVPDLPYSPLAGELPISGDSRDWNTVYAELCACSPELSAAAARIAKASANLQRQQVQPIPNVSLSAGVGTDLGTGSEFANVGVGVPLPLYNRNEGNIAAAQSEYCRACQDQERLRLNLKARLAEVAQRYDSALMTADRYQTVIVPKAEQTLILSEQAYAADQFGFVEVLIARRTFFDTKLLAIDARRELAQTTSEIEGLLLTGGLDETPDVTEDDSLRGQALSQQ